MKDALVSLSMYDWNEAHAETLKIYSRFADFCTEQYDFRPAFYSSDDSQANDQQGDQASVQNSDKEFIDLCRAGRVALGQTCWGLIDSHSSGEFRDYIDIVGQPTYDAYRGGSGAYYRSALVARSDDDRFEDRSAALTTTPSFKWQDFSHKTFARNYPRSRSGFLALDEDMKELAGQPLENVVSHIVTSGDHRGSVRTVAQGKADFAAVDCRSWDLALRFEPSAKQLRVFGWTSPRLGLPYVMSSALKLPGRGSRVAFRRDAHGLLMSDGLLGRDVKEL